MSEVQLVLPVLPVLLVILVVLFNLCGCLINQWIWE